MCVWQALDLDPLQYQGSVQETTSIPEKFWFRRGGEGEINEALILQSDDRYVNFCHVNMAENGPGWAGPAFNLEVILHSDVPQYFRPRTDSMG